MDLEIREALALSEDRSTALAQLLPGSEDHDYYACLHAQHAGRLDEAAAILAAWPERHGQTMRYQRMHVRQLLCRVTTDPSSAADELADELGVQRWHEPAAETIDPTRPTRLADGTFDGAKLLRTAVAADSGLSQVTDEGLLELLDFQLDATRRRSLLDRLPHSPHPRVVELVVEDLAARGSGGFGSLAVHALLTLDQLRDAGARRPELRGQLAWVSACVLRMRPHHTIDLETDRDARWEYLERLWDFVERLPAALNTLKAHVLWHLLDTARRRQPDGPLPTPLVRAYFSLPRTPRYVSAEWIKRFERGDIAQLARDFFGITGLPTAGDDEELVRDLLQRDLARAEQYKEWFEREWFEAELASATLLAGVGDAARATVQLGPARAAALRDRVELAWSRHDPAYFRATDPVVLDADVKNVPELVIKVFRIDPLAYFHHHKREVNTDLDLDGLAASHERTLTFDAPPAHRVRRRIDLPECARPGTYVIDLIGNGTSSRALVTKGRLRHVTRVGAAGHVVAILDESGAPRPDARAWIGEREYSPDAAGFLTVPFSTSPGRVPILLVVADLASVGSIELVRETYQLALNLLVDRETLAAARPARAIARVTLTVAGMPASLALLQQPTWDVTLTDRHGVATTRSQPLVLADDGAAMLEWPMPEDTAHVGVTVRGTVRVLSEGRDQSLVDARSASLSTIHGTTAIEALYLADTAAGWVLSALGKSGEPRAARPVTVMLVHRWARTQLDAELATDASGRIELGPLAGVEWIRATLADHDQPWLAGDVGVGATLAVASGLPVSIPLPPRRTAAEVMRRLSLVELRGGVPVRHPEVQIEPLEGALVIRGLPMGEYELRAPGMRVAVSVAGPGPEVNGCAIAPAEVLQTPRLAPAIATLASDERTIRLQLRGASSRTRVHVIATRFASALVDPLPLVPPLTPARRADRPRGAYYVSGRELGDEYRYVLERRSQKRYPSLLLDKPSLLLNPWSRRTTTTEVAVARGGGAFGASAMPSMQSSAARGYGGDGLPSSPDDYASYDFLPDGAAVIANLVPDATGTVTVDLAALGDAVTVAILVDDPAGGSRRHVALPERPLAPRDLRLRVALDPARHALQVKAIAPLVAGGTLAVEDLATAKLHLVDSIERAHAYLLALREDAALREFAFIARWHALGADERRALYSKYACHELGLYLWFKDRAFFEAVIAPHLAHKRVKTFVDHWLLGADLAPYLEPVRFEALNAAERALLAMRLVADRALPRLLEDQVAVMAPDPALDTRLVDALIGAATLHGDEDVKTASAAAFEMASVMADRPMALASMAPPPPSAPGAPMKEPRGGAGPAATRSRAAPMKAKKAAAPRDDDDHDHDHDADDLAESAADESGAPDVGGSAGAQDEMKAMKQDVARREQQAAHFRAVDKTQEWAEHNWWRRTPAESDAAMIAPSRLWRDLALHGATAPAFLSPWLGLASGSFAESMVALAVTALPAVAPKHAYVTTTGPRGSGLAITVAGHTLAGSSQLVDGELATSGAPLVVGTSYVRADDRYEWESGEQRDKYVETFVAGVVYTCLVVLANPTSSRQRIAALVQIPRGSVPVAGARTTETIEVALEPYGTHGHEYSFYFPQAGAWSHFPVHASRDGVIVAAAPARVLEVTASAAATDTTSWAHVSQRGSLADVVALLATANLAAIDVTLVAWRCKEAAAFAAIVGALEERHWYDATLWGYALMHRDAPRIRVWLRVQGERLMQAGPALEMLAIDAEDVGAYEYLELSPLVNARAHRLGGRLRILNDGLARQWDAFLELVAHRPHAQPEDLLAGASYLLAQDRVEAALAVLGRIDAARITDRMQHDYLAGYAACLTGEVGAARTRIAPWIDHPVDRWRRRFGAMSAMLDEVTGEVTDVTDVTGAVPVGAPGGDDARSREQAQSDAAARQPAFEIDLTREGITLHSQHVSALELRFFEMDVELLFSRQPFVQSDVSRFSFIEPGARVPVVDPPPETRVPWPAAMRDKHVVVEAVGAGQRKAKVHYANDLALVVANHLGQVRAVRASDRRPLATTYVKVYARKRGGAVAFYKDGYTDLRGWFDYASLSTTELDTVERFALLVASETAGAAIVEAAPPLR